MQYLKIVILVLTSFTLGMAFNKSVSTPAATQHSCCCSDCKCKNCTCECKPGCCGCKNCQCRDKND